jgi:hypothetical protein
VGLHPRLDDAAAGVEGQLEVADPEGDRADRRHRPEEQRESRSKPWLHWALPPASTRES